MASAWKIPLLLVLVLLSVVPSLLAVTTAGDVREALHQAASYKPQGAADPTTDPQLFEYLRILRAKTRDFAIGSIVDAARKAGTPGQLLDRARARVRQAGLPMREDPAAFGDLFAPSAEVEFFHVDGLPPEWIGARVQIGVPCGFDLSLFLWRLNPVEGEQAFTPELRFARESALTGMAEGVATQDYAVRQNTDSQDIEVASIDTGSWCSSYWRTATMVVARSSSHPYRPDRLFQHQEPVYLGDDLSPSVSASDSGFQFRFLTRYWLDVNRNYRLKELDVEVSHARASVRAPRAEDPALFLDQWVATPWRDSRSWTTGSYEHALRGWHETLSPDGADRLVTKVVNWGDCQPETHTAWVHLHALSPVHGLDVHEAAGHGAAKGSSDFYGVLRRDPDGFRVHQIVDKLPANCPVSAARP
jgi:hypothetical protein